MASSSVKSPNQKKPPVGSSAGMPCLSEAPGGSIPCSNACIAVVVRSCHHCDHWMEGELTFRMVDSMDSYTWNDLYIYRLRENRKRKNKQSLFKGIQFTYKDHQQWKLENFKREGIHTSYVNMQPSKWSL